MRVTSSMTLLMSWHLLDFLMSFVSLFHLRNVHLRPKFLYGNDRKSHADLLIHNSEKMSLFDQKDRI